jgi:hypothetical protein
MFVPEMTEPAMAKAVKGGQMTTSTPLAFARRRVKTLHRAAASAAVLFIFQFPATSGLRIDDAILSVMSYCPGYQM